MVDNSNTLISTVVSEGIDFAVSPVVAFNASGRKSFIRLIQFLGRITRKNEKFKKFRIYLDILDKENPFLLIHSNERIEICKQFGIDVQVCSSIQELIVDIIKYYKETTKEE
jgi:superfamily II DNA or RNA helicase